MVTEDYKNSKYFVVIDLSIKNENNSLFNPFKFSQPNSDLLFLSFFYFKPKINLSLTDFFNFGFLNFSNTLKIELKYSEKDTRNFMCFLRSISNLSSLSTGNYFYIPFKDCHYKMTSFLPFVVLVFLLQSFSFLYTHVLNFIYPCSHSFIPMLSFLYTHRFKSIYPSSHFHIPMEVLNLNFLMTLKNGEKAKENSN
ncbi:hypothetical protein NBO_467gi001 [Nosema bombycis CQ1]|uniref:Uncharacterized protein n=1 Tax=Nosema bombycis (strain CQ1 / CVCC 102059) TaxID=578461 RepID=R0M2P6_NOSB1|nr:hypothetical protein NBO_467gi001 [Nosema bombycis CQ1]|eukprot:EOB12299.1 hypothetical protein NBO_467gi001 [Nosema bombycis CQ1]